MAPKKLSPEVAQDMDSMSIDELWALHQKVAATLVAKMTAEKELIEDRLRLLNQVLSDENENNRARAETDRSSGTGATVADHGSRRHDG
jgi:hypothetical protein